MDDYKKLLAEEVETFKSDLRSKLAFNNVEEEFNIYLKCSLNDALNGLFRRKAKPYISIIDDHLQGNTFDEFKAELFSKIINDNNGEDFKKNYSNLMDEMKKAIKSAFADNLQNDDITIGILQKIVSMTLKYAYCYYFNCNEEIESHFQYCYMPLDGFTLQWFKDNVEQSEKCYKYLKKIGFHWSKIDDKELFFEIQDNISAILKEKKYLNNMKLNDKQLNIQLPPNRLDAEFIIWRYEQLNSSYNKLKRINEELDKYNYFKKLIQ